MAQRSIWCMIGIHIRWTRLGSVTDG